MKRNLLLLLLLILSIGLIACGEQGSLNDTNENNIDEIDNQEENKKERENDANKEPESDSNTLEIGEIVTSEAGISTIVSYSDNVGSFETGPFKLEIENVSGQTMEISDYYIHMFDDDEIEVIQVDMNVENTSEDHLNFYASQAIMTTNTGEQLESDVLMSEHIDARFLGAVKKSGTALYILRDSQAEEIETIKLFFDPPHNESYKSVGEEIEVEISLNK